MASDILSGAALTVALPLGTLFLVVLWGFFVRHPGQRFGGISKSTTLEPAGRPEIKATDAGAESQGGGVEGSLS